MIDSQPFYRRYQFWQLFLIFIYAILFLVFFWKETVLFWRWLGVCVDAMPWKNLLSLLNSQIHATILQTVRSGFDQSTRQATAILFLNGLLFLTIFLGFLFWLSQFLLPIRLIDERSKAFRSLLLYLFRSHGAAIFVKNGQVIGDVREMKRRLPGVVLVDLSSAIVLDRRPILGGPPALDEEQKKSLFDLFVPRKSSLPVSTRASGPGLVFTKLGEKVRGTVDLRKQIRATTEVHGLTRDGIEVKTNVFTVFSISEAPETILVTHIEGEDKASGLRAVQLETREEDGPKRSTKVVAAFYDLDPADADEIHWRVGVAKKQSDLGVEKTEEQLQPSFSPYQYDPERTLAAVYSQPFRVDESSKILMDWTELPNQVAIEIFRDKLAKYTFDYLYQPDNPDPGAFPLWEMKREFSFAVRSRGLLKYRYVERRDGKSIYRGQPWEDEQLVFYPAQMLQAARVEDLRKRGIRVIAAGFSELKPVQSEIRLNMLENWKARWEKEVDIAVAEHDLEAARIRNRARAQALRDSTVSLSDIFNKAKVPEEALVVRVFQALETAATDLSENRLLPQDTINMLWSLYDLLREEESSPGKRGNGPLGSKGPPSRPPEPDSPSSTTSDSVPAE